MTNLLSDLQEYKDKIPEFVIKLYQILETKQYNDYICWFGDGQILIKNGKKLEEKVLPHFFRHKHLSSFIRQLNMYKFSKVSKMLKQKKFMYFRNPDFQKGKIEEMMKIKRNNKKNRNQSTNDNMQQEIGQFSLSINRELQNNALLDYKQYVKASVKQIVHCLKNVQVKYPQKKIELQPTLNLCYQLFQQQQIPELQQSLQLESEENNQNKNIFSTMRLLPRLQSIIFPSQCSFYHIT